MTCKHEILNENVHLANQLAISNISVFKTGVRSKTSSISLILKETPGRLERILVVNPKIFLFPKGTMTRIPGNT